jgi:hypothetical protein
MQAKIKEQAGNDPKNLPAPLRPKEGQGAVTAWHPLVRSNQN